MELGLIDGALNLAITTYVPPASDKIVADEIFTEPLVLAVGAQHRLHGRARVGLAELAGVPLVLRAANTPSRLLIERCFAARGIAPNVAMEMSSGEATLATVRCSELATICAARALDSAPALAAVRINEPALKRTGAILWHRERYRSAAACILAQMVTRAYAPGNRAAARRAAGAPPPAGV